MVDTKQILEGSKKAIPIVLGYLPLGFAYGALAGLAGLSLPLIIMMSAFVFAGSSQFIAVSMLADGAAGASIIATVFAVNLRHLLMSASLAPQLRKFPRKSLAFISFLLTDENYAIACGELPENNRNHWFLLAMFFTAYLGWVAGGVLGGLFGGLFITAGAAYTMEYALYAMFIFLLVIQVTAARLFIAACVSGALALLFFLYLPGSWYIILAAACTATMGVILEKWKGTA